MSSLELPTACPTEVVPEIAAPAHQARHFRDVTQGRILIVDDESLNIDVVQGYLEMEGYQNIASTENAIQALPLVDTFRPDLVLLDIHMPDVSGSGVTPASSVKSWGCLPKSSIASSRPHSCMTWARSAFPMPSC